MDDARGDSIFVIKDSELHELPARSLREGILKTTLEGSLQKLIEDYPQIIPGAQINPGSDDPPRFVVLCREMPVSGFSVDLLLVDQYGVPTIVETKLAENPDSRRAVIGQLLEYAANAVEMWGNGRIREKATEYWSKKGKSLDDVIAELLEDEEADVEGFWDEVEHNLHFRRLRLILIGDKLRPEVQRTIEFLNQELRNVEFLGLQITCYGKGEYELVIVPRLVGQTQTTAAKEENKAKQWQYSELRQLFAVIENKRLSERLLKILEWTREHGLFTSSKSRIPMFGILGKFGKKLVTIENSGKFHAWLHEERFDGDIQVRKEFIKALNKLPIFSCDPNMNLTEKDSSGAIDVLTDEEFEMFLKILKEFCLGEKGKDQNSN